VNRSSHQSNVVLNSTTATTLLSPTFLPHMQNNNSWDIIADNEDDELQLSGVSWV
jgi:hypothetical protein